MNTDENTPRRNIDFVKLAAILICAAGGCTVLWLIWKFLLGALIPFITAALIASAVSPLAGTISEKARISRRFCSAVLVFLLLAVLTLLCSLGVRRLITELGSLAERIASGDTPVSDAIEKASRLLSDSMEFPDSGGTFPVFGGMELRLDAVVRRCLDEVVSAIGAALPGFLSALIGAMPGLLLGLAVTVISAFHFALDGNKVRDLLTSLLPHRARRMLPHIKKEAAQTAVRYLRAYSLILLLTFAELFFGFSVMGIEYSFVIALVIALVDILPVFGAGTVLIPWAIFSFITADRITGTRLIVIYIIVIVVRQFAEPRILGESLGIHPLLTLFAMYVGFRLFGIAGMLLGPAAAALIRTASTAFSTGSRVTP